MRLKNYFLRWLELAPMSLFMFPLRLTLTCSFQSRPQRTFSTDRLPVAATGNWRHHSATFNETPKAKDDIKNNTIPRWRDKGTKKIPRSLTRLEAARYVHDSARVYPPAFGTFRLCWAKHNKKCKLKGPARSWIWWGKFSSAFWSWDFRFSRPWNGEAMKGVFERSFNSFACERASGG